MTTPTPSNTSGDSAAGHRLPWNRRVDHYLDKLAQTAEAIDLILDETRIGTAELETESVDDTSSLLADQIGELEALVAVRDDLIRDPAAPRDGMTLTDKLLSTRHIEDARLARRCGEIAKLVETTHQRAVAMFVCQYHLSHLTNDLLALVSGISQLQTYGEQRPRTGGGGLFNDAA